MANRMLSTLGSLNLSPYQQGIQNVAQMRLKKSGMDALPATTDGASVSDATKAKLWEKSKEFETYFIQQYMDLTSPDLSDNPVMGGGVGEKAFNQKMHEEVAKSVVKGGGFGLANRVYTELLQAQEGKGHAAQNLAKLTQGGM